MPLKTVDDIISALDRSEMTLLLEVADGVDLRPVEAVMLQGNGACTLPEGTRLLFRHPASLPQGASCLRLIRALRPFAAAAAVGLSDEPPGGYMVTCPCPGGAVWRISVL